MAPLSFPRPSLVLVGSLAIALPFLIFGAADPQAMDATGKALVKGIVDRFDWFYMLALFAFLGFGVWLALGRHGDVRLGRAGEGPEFSTFSWLAMLFSAGMGSGLLFWGMAEPVSHYLRPPHGVPGTPEAAGTALTYTFFHWGVHAWAVYGIVGLALAWSQFKHGRPGLVSSAFEPLLGPRVHGPLGAAIDVFAVVATLFGVAATLGMSTSQLASGLKQVWGVATTDTLKLGLMAVLTVVYLASATTGLQRGIRWLSSANVVMAIGLLAVITVIGPTAEIFRAFTDGVGRYMQNFFQLSLGQTPFADRSWFHGWTMVYWPWWVAWAPFVGTFIARISRGRTIKEFVLGVFIAPALFSFFWFAAFGTTGIAMVRGGVALGEAIRQDVASALFVALAHLPLAGGLSLLAMSLMVVFFVTSADSAVYVLAMLTSRGNMDPPMALRIVWGVVLSGIGAVLLVMGGIQTIQLVTVVAALPFTVLMLGLCASLFKGLQDDARRAASDEAADRELASVA